MAPLPQEEGESRPAREEALSPEELRERVLRTAANVLTYRARSSQALYDRLVEKGAAPEDAAWAVARLRELGYLNEAAYAARIVEVYSARGFGEKKLRDELYRRGVPRDYWDDALEQIQDSTEAIDAFLQKKLAGWTGDRKQLQKVPAALARRGFSWSDIRDALARYETGIDIEYD